MVSKAIAVLFISVILISTVFSQNLQTNDNSDLIQLAIIGSNDLHGTAFFKTLKRTDNNDTYSYGGLVYASSLMQIIKKQYQGRVLYLDAGDQFQGGIQSSPQISKGQIMADFFNRVQLDGASLGNHQFDYSQQYLKQYLQKRNAPTILSNVQLNGSKQILKNQQPTKVFNIGGVKIGVIGLISQQTKQGSTGFLQGKFPKYDFLQASTVVKEQSQRLKRQQEAEIILLLTHIGSYCPTNLTFDMRTNQTKQQQCQTDELAKLLKQIPQGSIDGVIGGHRHTFMHHYYKNIPFMDAINGGYYFNVLHIVFNLKTRKIQRTAIQGPVPVCQRIFKNTKLCNYHDQKALETAGPLVRWKYHGVQVKQDQELKNIFMTKYLSKMMKYYQFVFETQFLLERTVDQQSPLANLITTMMAKGAQKVTNQTIDIAVLNQGGFRSTWYPGQVNLKQYYSMFSFADKLNKFYLTGKQIKNMQQMIQPGKRGFYYYYGIKQTVRKAQIKDPQTNQTKIVKQFVNATMMDGSQIIDDQTYSIVALDFLTSGGDDFSKVLNGYTDPQTNKTFKPIQLKGLQNIGIGRDIILQQLKQLKVIKKSQWGVNNQNLWTKVINQ